MLQKRVHFSSEDVVCERCKSETLEEDKKKGSQNVK